MLIFDPIGHYRHSMVQATGTLPAKNLFLSFLHQINLIIGLIQDYSYAQLKEFTFFRRTIEPLIITLHRAFSG